MSSSIEESSLAVAAAEPSLAQSAKNQLPQPHAHSRPVSRPDWKTIDAVLPQTQCRQCGYEGCAPYAKALATGETSIDRCPPGGEEGVAALAHLLQVPIIPLDRSRGETKPLLEAWIDESICIGCTLCIQACPTDAIIGAPKRLHQVVVDQCTGCELCIAPCPVDCIEMRPASPGRQWDESARQTARQLTRAREARLARLRAEHDARLQTKSRKEALLAAALKKARERRAAFARRHAEDKGDWPKGPGSGPGTMADSGSAANSGDSALEHHGMAPGGSA